MSIGMGMCAAGGYVEGSSLGACCPSVPSHCAFVQGGRGGLFSVNARALDTLDIGSRNEA
jgi:hypothetical protein